jgi:DNA-directed RNA polymerase III subunit RPC6
VAPGPRNKEERWTDSSSLTHSQSIMAPPALAPSRKRKQPEQAIGNPMARPKIVQSAFVQIKNDPDGNNNDSPTDLRERFINMFEEPDNQGGVANSALKTKFGSNEYPNLVPIINELVQASRLVMSRIGDELFYNLVSNEMANKFSGLDVTAKTVYQVIEKAGNMGIWTKDIRTQTNLQQQALTKIFKTLETRRLIKPVKSVAAKAKKLYMAYHLTPAKELTGGPWYTELEFDHEFINEMRKFLMQCVLRINSGMGVSIAEIKEKIVQANISKVELSIDDVHQLMQTLAFDQLIDQLGTNMNGEALFVAARRTTPMCDFKWWDAIAPDFHFREIRFEDGVVLAGHEPHHHTAS